MGEATDRKVTEIDETRRGLETDLRELEARLPAPLRSTKSLAGVIVGGTALAAFLFRRSRKRSDGPPAAEVVIRIVRDDV